MSIKTFDHALDFLPRAMRTGPGNNHRGTLARVLEAISDAREAQAEYQRQLSHGVDPSIAVKSAFDKAFAGR